MIEACPKKIVVAGLSEVRWFGHDRQVKQNNNRKLREGLL